jgi:tRNA dimethylallyltransferase
MRRTIVALVGATATGKTAVAEAVAAKLGGEVVCADARQLFRELEIGTGKPTPAERARLPHHLFDWLSLGERPSAGGWARAAAAVCEACFARGTLPVLVGGSGLYVDALQRGLHPEPPRDDGVRARLGRECEMSGVEALHARLATLDPDAARTLKVRDRQRVLRALEVVEVSGHTLGWWRAHAREAPLAADWRAFQLVVEPGVLRARIAARTETMWRDGLLAETRALVAAGKEDALRRLSAIGYDEALEVLAGRLTPEAAKQAISLRTAQLAKRQRTWFRHQLPATAIGATGGVLEPSVLETILGAVGAAGG